MTKKNLPLKKYWYFFAATIGQTSVNFEASVDKPIQSLDDIREVVEHVLPSFIQKVPILKDAGKMIVSNFILLRTE